MLIQSLLIGLWAGITGLDMFNGLTHIHRPVVTGLVVGLILGDWQTGLIAGGLLELVWMGLVPLAGAQPPNAVIGGIIGTALAIILMQEAETAVTLAVPFAVAAQAGIVLFFSLFAPVMHLGDKYASQGNLKGIDKINYLGLAILFTSYFLAAFLPIFFGAEHAARIVGLLPPFLIGGLGIAGGMMPAIGFAILLKIMLKKAYVAFLLGGFVLAAFLNLSILAVAVLGVAVALYDFYAKKGSRDTKNERGITDGI